MAKELRFSLTPTQRAYVESDAVVNAIIGPMGDGKTYASIAAIIRHAQRCGGPIRAAIIRDTLENLKNSTVQSFFDVFKQYPHLLKFRDEFKKLTILTSPRVECHLFGIDDPVALSKLQGPEYALVWLEEPAPIVERMNAGLSEEVFNAALARCARQAGTIPRLQISMNPADEDHWTYRRLVLEPDVNPDFPLITKRVFFVPYGENIHLKAEARQATMAAYQHDKAGFTRYVEGRFAPAYRGKKVTPEYNPEIHLSKVPLQPAKGLVSFRIFDGWHNPACLLGQITHSGRLVFLDLVMVDNGDIRTLIETKVRPLLESPRWKDKAAAWRDGGDRSMMQPDQSNKQMSAAKVVEALLNTYFEPAPHLWPVLREGIKHALNTMVGGEPAVVINRELLQLHRQLDGAWHYKTDVSGNVIKLGDKPPKPVKDEHSRIGECFAYACAILRPTKGVPMNHPAYRRQRAMNLRRAQSYAAGGL
ncbi:MAG: phage terminase large subunit [Syntrophobacterales bacterium]|nr:phage terminase large subunit [Syntrophobacterales bacterium]